MPAYLNAPFDEAELRGRFVWNRSLTEAMPSYDRWMYVAMHEERLRIVVQNGRIGPQRSFNVEIDGEVRSTPCSWFDFRDWAGRRLYNHFGPFIVRINFRELEGRRFYVFERGKIGSRNRVFFVQREERTALFGKPAQRIDPRTFFEQRRDGSLQLKEDTHCELLLTKAVSLAEARVEAAGHPVCFATSEKCSEKLDKSGSIKRLEGILGIELPRRPMMFPRPFPLRHVIPPRKLLQPA